MAIVYQNYPYGLDDQALQNAINSYSQAMFDSRANINVVLQYSPLMQLGQAEVQKRLADRGAATARRLSYVSLIASGVALVLSVLGVWSSSRWESTQLQAIAEMNGRLGQLVVKQQHMIEVLNQLPARTGAEIAKQIQKVNSAPATNKSPERAR